MIHYVTYGIFESDAHTLVNPVNTVGVMGAGLALEFKRMFPEVFKEYKIMCDLGFFDIGELLVYRTDIGKIIVNFPTKRHWNRPSEIEYIEKGLRRFVEMSYSWNFESVSFPMLGCGNGGLDFEAQVKPLMEKFLPKLDLDVFVHVKN